MTNSFSGDTFMEKRADRRNIKGSRMKRPSGKPGRPTWQEELEMSRQEQELLQQNLRKERLIRRLFLKGELEKPCLKCGKVMPYTYRPESNSLFYNCPKCFPVLEQDRPGGPIKRARGKI